MLKDKIIQQFVRDTPSLIDTHLWQPRQAWAERQLPGVTLTVLIAEGSSTFHRHRAGHPKHVLNFGRALIGDCLSADTACGWLSTTEIIERDYFSRQLFPAMLWAHVVAHEFSHFITSLIEKDANYESHGPLFYRVLDRAHHSGVPALIARELQQRTIAMLPESAPLLYRNLYGEIHEACTRRFQVGDRVEADTERGLFQGQVRAFDPDRLVMVGTVRNRTVELRAPHYKVRPRSG